MANKYYSLQGKLKKNGELYNFKIHRRNLYGFSRSSLLPFIPNGRRYYAPTLKQIMQLLRVYKQYTDWHTSPSDANFSSCLLERTDYFLVLRQIYSQQLFDSISSILHKGIYEYQMEIEINEHSWLKEDEENLSSEEKCKAVYANMYEIAHRMLRDLRRANGNRVTVMTVQPTTVNYSSDKERYNDYLSNGSAFYKCGEALAVPSSYHSNGPHADVCLALALTLALAYRAYGAYVFLMGDATYRKTPLYPVETKIAFDEYKRVLATGGDMMSILIAYADAIAYVHRRGHRASRTETNCFV